MVDWCGIAKNRVRFVTTTLENFFQNIFSFLVYQRVFVPKDSSRAPKFQKSEIEKFMEERVK